MNQHLLRALACAGAILSVPGLGAAQPDGDAGPPRTPWGVPNLEGTWSLPTMTPLERPAEFEGRERLTAEEEAEFLARRRSGIRAGLARALSADFELGDGGSTNRSTTIRSSTDARRWWSRLRMGGPRGLKKAAIGWGCPVGA